MKLMSLSHSSCCPAAFCCLITKGPQPVEVACMMFVLLNTDCSPNHKCAAWLSPISRTFGSLWLSERQFLRSKSLNLSPGSKKHRCERYGVSELYARTDASDATRLSYLKDRPVL